MKIGIIGAGNVGTGLAKQLVRAGHEVTLSASSPASQRLADAVKASGAVAGIPAVAVEQADVVILAFPFAAVDEALDVEVVAAAAGKTVIDATNPLAADYMSLTIGHTTSGGEQIAARMPRSHVVKAFNTVFADALAQPSMGGVRQLLPVAGDDGAAKKTVLDLGAELGFDAVDTGDLKNSRYLEPAVELLIQLGFGKGLGTGIGFALTRTNAE